MAKRAQQTADMPSEPVEGPWELPEGWRWERLGDVCEPSQYGWTTSAAPAGSIKFLRTTDISSGRVDWATVPYCLEAPTRTDQYLLKHDDIVISRAGSVGKSFILQHPERSVFASYLIRYRPKISARYVYWWLQTSTYWNCIIDNTAGIAVPNVNASKLSQIALPVPPRDVQKKIVASIDELFTELDDADAALARARADLGVWRKALLKAAVTGELTADWRAANPPTETGADLLSRILADRRTRWAADPKNKGKRYVEPVGPDTSELPELPEGWVWATLGQLLDDIEAGLNVKCVERPPEAGETGLVKISAVTWWDFNERASKTLAERHDHPEKWLIAIGDLLISRANTLELVGAPAIVNSLTRRLMLSDKVLRLNMPQQFRQWCFYVMRSPFGRLWIEAHSTGAQMSMRNIAQDALRRMPIPIPSNTELAALDQTLNDSFASEQGLSTNGADLKEDAATLRQSILAAAFRGELVQ